MKNTIKKAISSLTCLALLLTMLSACITANAAVSTNDTDIINALDATANHLLSLDSSGSEWAVMGLARAEKIDEQTKASYLVKAEELAKNSTDGKLSTTKSTENSKVIIALSSLGIKANDFCGVDLTAPLADLDYVTKQGLSAVVYALIALDTLDYQIPKTNAENPATRENMIEYILSKKLENGGWAFFGTTPDPDMTAMVIQSLAPYYNKNSAVKEAVDKALDAMSAIQTADGGLLAWGSVSSESSAQMIAALTSLGINPNTDPRFIKENGGLLDSVMSFSVENGFSHAADGKYNQMATEQCFYALVSYSRLINGKTSLYDMSDLIKSEISNDVNGDGVTDISDCTAIQKIAAGINSDFTAEQIKTADIDGDAIVTVSDATALQKILVAK